MTRARNKIFHMIHRQERVKTNSIAFLAGVMRREKNLEGGNFFSVLSEKWNLISLKLSEKNCCSQTWQSKMSFKEKNCIVTGAALGLGRAFCEQLLKQGAFVRKQIRFFVESENEFINRFVWLFLQISILDLDSDAGELCCVELQQQFGKNRVIFCHCDVTDFQQFEGTEFFSYWCRYSLIFYHHRWCSSIKFVQKNWVFISVHCVNMIRNENDMKYYLVEITYST